MRKSGAVSYRAASRSPCAAGHPAISCANAGRDRPKRSAFTRLFLGTKLRAYAWGVQLSFIRPGKSIENAFIESFDCKFRDECFNEHWFASLAEGHALIEAGRVDYSTVRPHRALAGERRDSYPNSLRVLAG